MAAAAAVDLGTYSVIANKMPRPVQEVIGTVTVIDGERLQNEVAQDIQQALRYEPGISVSRDGARFGISGYNIRGVTGNRVQIEMDGIPIPNGFRVGSFSNAGRDLVDVELLSRVEILRGPASALYGSDAIGGVVAYSTWDPEDFLWRVDDDSYLGLRGGYFSVDDSWVGTVTGAGESGNWQGMVLFSARDGRERENNGNIPSNPADFNTQNLLAKVIYDASGKPLRFTLQG